MSKSFLAAIATMVVAGPVFAYPLGETVFTAGAWSVHRSQDPMTDEIRCVGLTTQSTCSSLAAQFACACMRSILRTAGNRGVMKPPRR